VDDSEDRSTAGPGPSEGPEQGNQSDETQRSQIERRKGQEGEDTGGRRGGQPRD
jgi:hypothetical protein